MWDFKNWKTALLLSVIIPISLLTSFKLSGILREPLAITETNVLSAEKADFERPYGSALMNETLNAFYSQELISADLSICLTNFFSVFSLYGGSDVVNISTNVTTVVAQGFINNINITFLEEYQYSQIWLREPQNWPSIYDDYENLMFIDYAHTLRQKGLKAFMEFGGTNRPKSVHLSVQGVDWVLRTPKNHAHKLSINMELTYFNGTAYKKVVQPFQIQIAPDNNNSFEEAQTIAQGTYSKLYLGGYDWVDYYKIYVPRYCLIQVRAYEMMPEPQVHPDFNINLYDPERKWKTGSSSSNYSHTVSYTADSAGEWFIQTLIDRNFGFYELQICLYP
jgi:hypothetical protein